MGEVLFGALLIVVGLTLFIQGLEMGLFPISEAMAHALARKGSPFWLLLFSFALGFSTTVAEPALIAVAAEAAEIADRSPAEVHVYEIITNPLITVPADMDIRYAARLIYRADIRRAPVEDSGKLIGMTPLASLILDNDLFWRLSQENCLLTIQQHSPAICNLPFYFANICERKCRWLKLIFYPITRTNDYISGCMVVPGQLQIKYLKDFLHNSMKLKQTFPALTCVFFMNLVLGDNF